MRINDCYKIGYVLKPHGLKGEVTVSIDQDAPDFSVLETVFIEQKNALVPYFVDSVSLKGDKAFVKFEDVDTHEGANALSKSAIYLPKASRPKSGRGEFYDDEIIGFTIHEKEIGVLGMVESVTEAGPNKLLVAHYHDKEVLIPVNGPFIKGINKTKKTITVELPDGYLEI